MPADFSLAWMPFKPMNGADTTHQLATVTAAVGTSAGNVTLPVGDAGNSQIEIYNASTGVASINFGTASVAAVSAGSGYQVGPGVRRVITVDPFVTTASCLSSVAGNVSFTRGMGAN